MQDSPLATLKASNTTIEKLIKPLVLKSGIKVDTIIKEEEQSLIRHKTRSDEQS